MVTIGSIPEKKMCVWEFARVSCRRIERACTSPGPWRGIPRHFPAEGTFPWTFDGLESEQGARKGFRRAFLLPLGRRKEHENVLSATSFDPKVTAGDKKGRKRPLVRPQGQGKLLKRFKARLCPTCRTRMVKFHTIRGRLEAAEVMAGSGDGADAGRRGAEV